MGRRSHRLPTPELATRIRRGDLSPVAVVDAYLDRIAACDDEINAFVDVYEDDARAAAREAERAVEAGDELGPLHGVPVAVKDNYAVAGKRFTNGSVPLADHVADADDLTVRQLRAAGAIVLGKTNTPELATKAVTDNDLFGPTGTPFDPDRTAGGSSGGSAAAVAAGMVPLALGTDGGGSLRIPASACGVFGIKPTFGRVPIALRPDGFSHHTPMRGRGPQTRTVEGGAMMLDVLAGPHPADPFALEASDVDLVAATRQSVADLTVAWTVDLDGAFPIDPRVRDVFEGAISAFESTPATVTAASPDLPRSRTELYACWKAGFAVVLAETLENLKREGRDLLGDHRDDLDAANVDLAERGRAMSAVEYRRWDVVRTELFEAMQSFFGEYDALLLPTIAVPPFEHGTWGPESVAGEAVEPPLEWTLTWPFNLTGHPAASVPAGFTDDGLPVGLQIVGPRFDDARVLALSGAFERVEPWHDAYDRVDG
ncbi:amidase [Haloplanus halophilus]|uniref:amidase n=1 Tax=Haloplanus halophilus TaxID=2949993 RepID=UPI00203C2FB3|nr:amidase [Haloplanus sp. GDY1]